jgi:hypothetical protein
MCLVRGHLTLFKLAVCRCRAQPGSSPVPSLRPWPFLRIWLDCEPPSLLHRSRFLRPSSLKFAHTSTSFSASVSYSLTGTHTWHACVDDPRGEKNPIALVEFLGSLGYPPRSYNRAEPVQHFACAQGFWGRSHPQWIRRMTVRRNPPDCSLSE